MMKGTQIAVRMMPTLAPALKMPVAKLRSFFGNHSETVLIAEGKLVASPTPEAESGTG
jgi:hypothetical protein